ncbi:L,D-transpeptidase family protein [Pseudochelatococcus sp. G4_1912]|uniref:L,D-transpeptidase family protein n=1 Tax=Pseudochelatococcus sp. G4_1912 TaxID=3114288 RepID=UPI0039C710C6
MFKRLVFFVGVGVALAGCQESGKYASNAKARAPIPAQTVALMQEKGMKQSSPILIRSYKKESELEVWKMGPNGRYALLKTYAICRWSGQLGPKKKEGDRQAPEGFYTITPALMNPNSSYYLSFDTGYPNTYDRANGRTGSHLMVHGACSSAGCYSMTDEQIAEIYSIGREAFNGGQRKFQFQAYPFRMTAENMAKHRLDPNIDFWRNLKEGSDHFEATGQEPAVAVCGKRYVFNARNSNRFNASGACPALDIDPAISQVVSAKSKADEAKIADLLSKGTPAVRLVYQDGGQHPVFTGGRQPGSSSLLAFSRRAPNYDASLVSRPDALAAGPQEIVVHDGRAPVTQSAVATAPAARNTAASIAAGPISRPAAAVAATTQPTVEGQSLLTRMMSFTGFGSSAKTSPAAEAIVAASNPAPTAASAATPVTVTPPARPATPGLTGIW